MNAQKNTTVDLKCLSLDLFNEFHCRRVVKDNKGHFAAMRAFLFIDLKSMARFQRILVHRCKESRQPDVH